MVFYKHIKLTISIIIPLITGFIDSFFILSSVNFILYLFWVRFAGILS
ncbi:MAG: hypothetical protein XD56_2091 [Pseudothermotoga lettingae]|nr:MAG: hypothetical protein XD56_2091 [Pseudothermotoga lettingae]